MLTVVIRDISFFYCERKAGLSELVKIWRAAFPLQKICLL